MKGIEFNVIDIKCKLFVNELIEYLESTEINVALFELYRFIKNKGNEIVQQLPIENKVQHDIKEEYDFYEDITNSYDFGFKFNYFYSERKHYITPKWSNLKEEITHNTIYALPVDEWNSLMEHCNFYLSTETAKKHLPQSNGNELMNGIKPENMMQLKHLQSIKLYTDFTLLCNSFCSTFRKINENEIYEQVKQRHMEFVHWSQTLLETVQCFGEYWIYNSLINKMYRGITSNFIFNKFMARFNAPTSTSKQSDIAYQFATKCGMVLELTLYQNLQCIYFDCSKISRLPESECLFFGGETILKIITIKNVINEEWFDYIHYLEGINFLLTMIRGGDSDQ
eukprot:47170_1